MADLAVAGERGAIPRLARPLDALSDLFAAEGDRRALWLPVLFGAGIAVYFALTMEPPRWAGLAGAITAAGCAFGFRHWAAWRDAAIALAFAAAGFAAVQQASIERGTPMLQRRVGPVPLTGAVIDIEALDRGWRIVVAPDPIPRLDTDEQPKRVRVHVAPNSDTLTPGDRVSLKAQLYPVPSQLLPGGRDMQRELYFAG